jgi:hypothetical protein
VQTARNLRARRLPTGSNRGPVDNSGVPAVTPVYFLEESWSGGGAGLDSAAWLEWLST